MCCCWRTRVRTVARAWCWCATTLQSQRVVALLGDDVDVRLVGDVAGVEFGQVLLFDFFADSPLDADTWTSVVAGSVRESRDAPCSPSCDCCAVR
jgi:hypothetical protein